MNRQQVSKTKYLAVFATTTLIFIIGIMIGNYVSASKMKNLDNLENQLRADTMAAELQYLLLSENPCIAQESVALSEELYGLGSKLSYMEDRLGAVDPSVVRMKEYYSLLEIRHWLFLKKTRLECNKNHTLILYFYSKEKENCPDCEEQGYVLTYLREKYPGVKVYSFDFETRNAALDTVKEIYLKEQGLPILIINDQTYYGFKNKEAMEKIIIGEKDESP